MLIHEDLPARIEIENVNFASDLRLKQLANTIPQLAWMADPDGRIHWYNDRWYDYTGTVPGNSDGWDWQSVHDPQILPEVLKQWKHSLASGEPFQMAFPLRDKDGRFRQFFTLVAPLRDTSGKIIQWFGTNTDVSPLQEKEQALCKAVDELKEAGRRKDEFLAMLAHELRNPLAPISAAAQLLVQLSANPPSSTNNEEQVGQASRIISRQVKHMTELIDDLLDVSRVTRGLVQLEKESLDLKPVLGSAIEQIRSLVEAKGHTLTTTIASEQLSVHGDRTRLIQVVANLLNNAAKYTPSGGKIVLRAEVQNTEIRISVTDNGNGIDESLLPRVFELFTQAERTPDRSQGGLGIGLALVRSIMAMHDGQVEVYSGGLGMGSAFTLTLPLRSRSLQQHDVLLNGGPLQSIKPVRIMIVDDNQDAGQSLAALLEAEGHQVKVKEDARSALRESAVNFPQIFILDIGLPDMSGYELLKQLRLHPVAAQAIFIALTGYGQAEDRVLSKAAGFDYHFVKPVDTRQLAEIFATVR